MLRPGARDDRPPAGSIDTTGTGGAAPVGAAPLGALVHPTPEVVPLAPSRDVSSATAWPLWRSALLSFVVYAGLSLAALWPIWPGDPHALSSCACSDPVEQTWFLAWTPLALLHGHNPFVTHFLDYPAGANLSTNPLMPLLGLLGTPLTLTAGPVATFNLFLWLAFPLSALACFVLLRRWVRWAPAAFAGGLLYGFSPYMVGQGVGHLNLLFVPFPPLIVLLVDELLVRQRRRPVVTGVLLGLAAAAQYLISSEVFGATGLLIAIGLLVLAATRPRLAAGRLRRALPGLAAAGLVGGALVAYPVWVQTAGPRHLVGSVHGSYPFPADLLGPVVPTVHQLFAPSTFVAISNGFILGSTTENGSYLGIPLLVLALAVVVWQRRRPLVRLAAFMAVVAELLSLGPYLTVDRHTTGVPLPMKALDHLPLVVDFVDARFSLYVDLCVAVLVAVGADALWAMVRDRVAARPPAAAARAAHRRRRRVSVPVVVLAAGLVAAFVPLVPAWPYPAFPAAVPPAFATAAGRLPPGSVVMTYPYTTAATDRAMLWQAVTGMRVRLVGGYSLVPGPGGVPSYTYLPPHFDSVVATLVADQTTPVPPSLLIPPTAPATPADVRRFVRHEGVGAVMAQRSAPGAAHAIRLFRAALGRPRRVGDFDVWATVHATP